MKTETEESKNQREDENKTEVAKNKGELIRDYGQIALNRNRFRYKIHLLNIIGEIEGHDNLPSQNKTSKYEHILPLLAAVEDDEETDGVLVLLNTVGGDVEAGLAIAEMLASLSKPVVSLVLGGGHSIGVPLAASSDVSFIVPSATMVVHPIRINGTVLGVKQNYEYIERMQDRIIEFTASHSDISEEKLRGIMFNTKELTKDIGSVLVGREAVEKGIIDRVGGINQALSCLYGLINEAKNCKMNPYEQYED
jgi:ATP-dependent protease ClpP protease subunit